MRYVIEVVSMLLIFGLCSTLSEEAGAQPGAENDQKCNVPAGTEPFEFEVDGDRLRGYIDRPSSSARVPAVLMVNGSLPTNVMSGASVGGLRQVFRDEGIAFVTWDNPGSGCSEGESSELPDLFARADELGVALERLRDRSDIDETRIGALALSQGTWVASILATRSVGLAFLTLISAPSADMTQQATHLVQTNLRLAGYSEEEVARLTRRYRDAQMMALAGASYDDYNRVIQPLVDHAFFQRLQALGGNLRLTRAQYERLQNSRSYLVSNRMFLSTVSVPILAVYGAKDTLVDWRTSMDILQEALAQRAEANFTSQVLDDTNHNMCLAETGSLTEMVTLESCEVPEGLAQTVTSWLRRMALLGR